MTLQFRQLTNKAEQGTRLLLSDPRGFLRRLKPYLFKAKSGLIDVNGIKFRVDLELDPAMRRMYFGCYETGLTNLLRRFLRKGDTFVDVGANVGYISAYALGLVGKSGSVHAFEPVPEFAARLKEIRDNNPEFGLQVNEVALGEHAGKATIAVTSLRNIGWNTMVPGFMRDNTIREKMEIDVIGLSDYLFSHEVKNLRLVKIDTEGYEFPVMKGFTDYLKATDTPPILVIEVAPSAYPRMNTSCAEFSDYMKSLGYVPRSIDRSRAIRLDQLVETTDVAFLPESEA